MNQRLIHANPFTRFGMMAVVLSFAAVACVAQRSALSDAQVALSAQPVEAEVLLYTDNTPGSIFWAKTRQEVSRRMGMAVEVVTDVETFIEALPEKNWKEVIVVARYERGEPSYAAALRKYMRTGEREGSLLDQYARDVRVRFYYWYDSPASPVADVSGTMVVSSTLMQDWLPTGGTLISYSGGGLDAPGASIVPAYMFAAFDGVSPDSTKRFKNSVMKVLEPGVYAPKAAPESSPVAGSDGDGGPEAGSDDDSNSCSEIFFPELQECETTYNDLRAACWTLHGPSGGNDPTKYNKCLNDVSETNVGCRKGVLGVYVICEALKAVLAVSEIAVAE